MQQKLMPKLTKQSQAIFMKFALMDTTCNWLLKEYFLENLKFNTNKLWRHWICKKCEIRRICEIRHLFVFLVTVTTILLMT